MELRHFRYFVAVAEELNFTRAAERLHMAQPPLSTQIRLLEEDLGAQLFVREKRRVYLTQAGRDLLVRARGILAAADDARLAVRRAARGESGELHLGYTASAMFTEVLPGAIRRFKKRMPHIQLHLHEMSSMDQLYAIHHRELDVGIVRQPATAAPPGVQFEEWYEAPLVAAMSKSHALAERKTLAVGDLKDEPLIVFPRDSGIGLHWRVVELCTKAGFRPRIAHETRDYAVMIGLVAAGVGIAVVPTDTRCIGLEGVTYRPLAGKDAVSSLKLAFRSDDSDDAERTLLTELRTGRS